MAGLIHHFYESYIFDQNKKKLKHLFDQKKPKTFEKKNMNLTQKK